MRIRDRSKCVRSLSERANSNCHPLPSCEKRREERRIGVKEEKRDGM